MKQTLTISLMLLISIYMYGQEQEGTIEHDYKGNVILTWAPLSALDMYSRVRLGAEVGLTQRVSVSTDIGFNFSEYTYGNYNSNSNNRSYSVFEVRPEVKVFLNDKYRARWYNALELYYNYVEEEFEDGYYYKDRGDVTISYDAATYTRAKFGAHYKFGLSLRMGSRMVFDPFVGLGLRFVDRKYVDVENPITDPSSGSGWDEWLWSDAYRYEGKTWGLNFTGGFRLGIYLSK